MSFYLTLPSDNSLNYFPENKISHFITRLPTPIELRGEWEVGLVELMYPHTWYNVNEQNNLIGYALEKNGKIYGRRIPPGCYEYVPELLRTIHVKEHENKIYFDYNYVTKRVTITVKNDAKVIFDNGLAPLLGFESKKEIATSVEEPVKSEEGSFVADLSASYQVLMIYTDIVEPQIVGGILAPLLRIVKVRGEDGEMISEQYDRPHYLPVSRKHIETLEIVIRTNLGNLVPFERGRSYVKLHFRQKYLS